MAYIDFLSSVHKSTQRDYLARVNDPEFPKPKAAELAKQWGFDYWDGDRRICYGGYRYMPGRWAPVAQAMIDHYGLKAGDKVLDVGCGKGFLLYEMSLLVPGLEIHGIDISPYALEHAKEEIRDRLLLGNATSLPFPDQYFDFVFSITTLHNLHNYDLDKALREMERVGKQKYVCVESYRNETEKANLLYWQVTCEAFCTPEEWDWWFRQTGYTGDHSLIYFE
ncbi:MULTISPECIES: class I SAM-dependent methyltransferase [Herbaspirillum]|jgi:SAM-dependent methyltransferase|uniref:Class I SAM-dependent methyltransferase n=3 Tax=Herbaspirillum huttiense TaxID=863372 RepID=A0AAJ2LQQ6_9BURK|nr:MULTISPECIES: class I SAM-dependent methyltransferase [Herbaspirillum]MBN9357742.1 methyltransferase domain-containing protein [Herbaspirillum huttiense]MBP1317476.1 protein-L-isoaspartate(D-aspartate) O-methyltransferase [Herbaspirillum sp. 1130]MCO4857587.1 class I SAM-dependent methyltransferase [Herbaspirillum sp. WGmk3]MCP3657922.1 methyltransferase domain-containing protein [Herbaspirillum sp.]MCP3946453.1 methyltransferase domain-containing protein [Herbaspirillum sp.]